MYYFKTESGEKKPLSELPIFATCQRCGRELPISFEWIAETIRKAPGKIDFDGSFVECVTCAGADEVGKIYYHLPETERALKT